MYRRALSDLRAVKSNILESTTPQCRSCRLIRVLHNFLRTQKCSPASFEPIFMAIGKILELNKRQDLRRGVVDSKMLLFYYFYRSQIGQCSLKPTHIFIMYYMYVCTHMVYCFSPVLYYPLVLGTRL